MWSSLLGVQGCRDSAVEFSQDHGWSYQLMRSVQTAILRLLIAGPFLLASILSVHATPANAPQEEEFGPVVRAYLGYLRNEQEVVDDRASRREVSAAYYRHNSNRIRALRQIAIRIARETQNDYLPELEAVSRPELSLLFEQPPRVETLSIGEVLRHTFRFLGTVRSGETFYVFARLDPYEQLELREKEGEGLKPPDDQNTGQKALIRTRRVTSP